MSDPYASAVGGAAGRSTQLDHVLATLLRQAPDIEAAAVVSFDGLPMASALPASMDEDRVAAMSAALLSLGERAAQGLGRGDLSQVYVEGDNGTVFLVSADDEAVLVAVARAGAKVGLMLFEAKGAADAVAAALRIEPVAQPVPQPAPEPVAQPVAEPVAPQPAPHPVPQPVAFEPAPEPMPQPQVQPQPMPQPQQVQQPQQPQQAPQQPQQVQPQPVQPQQAQPQPVQPQTNGHAQPQPQPQPQPVPQPRPVQQVPTLEPDPLTDPPQPSSWDDEEPRDRRPATVAPDGSAWS